MQKGFFDFYKCIQTLKKSEELQPVDLIHSHYRKSTILGRRLQKVIHAPLLYTHPERRYTYLQTFSPYPQALKAFRAYRDCALKEGYEPKPSQLGWAVPTYVAETDAQARRDLQPHIEAFFNKFIKFPSLEMRLPPGYSSIASTKALMAAKFQARANATIDKLIEQGIIVCGSPDTVRERIIHCQNEMGFGHLMAMLQIGTQPAEMTERSMRLFADEVMPGLKAHEDVLSLETAAA